MSYTGTLTNVLTDTGTADALINPAFKGMLDVMYSTINYIVQFIFQPTVLASLVSLIVIGIIAGFAYRKMRSHYARG